ncbi:serine hydrolase domain-containing protein [Micromonospora fluostatini]|uniref:serine hydrolase domain-containing protein n=1 Tax=Micromonospora sp. JCM 30529 TaxID=3421643 RepID=UPI003D16762B
MGDAQERVRALLDALVATGAEDGLQVAVYRYGELLVDAVAGVADPATGRPVTGDTLFWSASTGKAATSTVAHVLVERGVFGYDTPVAELWPEFAAQGKGTATVRHVLTHSVGLPGLPADITPERLCDWDGMCRLLAGARPWWTPGERVGYHAVTFGYLVGEIVRRATGRRISQVLADEVAGPLGVADELYLGVPAAELPRVARLTDDPVGRAAFAALPADFPLLRAAPPGVLPDAGYGNRTDVLTSDIPAGGTLTARGIARMYAALLDEVDGVRLLSPQRLSTATTLATAGRVDELGTGPSTWAMGYSVGRPGRAAPGEHPTVFGMVGMGGSAAWADRATGISVAVTRNRFNPVDMTAVERVWDLVRERYG